MIGSTSWGMNIAVRCLVRSLSRMAGTSSFTHARARRDDLVGDRIIEHRAQHPVKCDRLVRDASYSPVRTRVDVACGIAMTSLSAMFTGSRCLQRHHRSQHVTQHTQRHAYQFFILDRRTARELIENGQEA